MKVVMTVDVLEALDAPSNLPAYNVNAEDIED